MLCPVGQFLIFFDSFLIFEFVLRQFFLILAPAALGRRDGSICALRKRRSRNETDNFIESISQMVPRWSPEVPRGPQWARAPLGPFICWAQGPGPYWAHLGDSFDEVIGFITTFAFLGCADGSVSSSNHRTTKYESKLIQ